MRVASNGPDIRVVSAYGGSLNILCMTTQDDDPIQEERSVTHTWDVTPPPDPDAPRQIEFYESLLELLKPYQPVDNERDSDLQYSTNELIQALEQHYGVPQGDPDVTGIDTEKLVDYMKALGYVCVNTGGLQLQWLLRKKNNI